MIALISCSVSLYLSSHVQRYPTWHLWTFVIVLSACLSKPPDGFPCSAEISEAGFLLPPHPPHCWLGKLTPDTELVRSKCLCKGEEKHTFCCYSQHFCVAAARMVTFLFINSFIVLLCETDTRPMFSPGLASMAKQNRNTNQQITHSRSHQDCCHSCQRICWKGTNKKC